MNLGRDSPDARARSASEAPSLAPALDPIRTMLERAAHAMLVVDPSGRVMHANPRAEALLDRGRGDLEGMRVSAIVREEDRAALEGRIRASARGVPAPEDLELELLAGREGGSLLEVSFLPFDGPLVALLLRDLTEERAARSIATERERNEYVSATQANRKMADLGRLISGVSHELRTPLTFITNTLELERKRLEEVSRGRADLQPLFDEILNHHRAIEGGIARVNRLVRDLRPLTKNRPYRTTPMDLAELVVEAVRVFRGAHGGNTRVELDLQATHRIPLDREDMHHVVLNLLNNAAEAMDHGGVVRVVTRNYDEPPTIRVIDHGPGIAPSMVEQLFQPFQTTKREGTGLGLFISRRTVEAHGGTLTYEPTPGGGATFVVRLPMPPGEDEGRAA